MSDGAAASALAACACVCIPCAFVKSKMDDKAKEKVEAQRQRDARDRSAKYAKQERKRLQKMRKSDSKPAHDAHAPSKASPSKAGALPNVSEATKGNKLKLELSPWFADQQPIVTKTSEGVHQSEILLGRGLEHIEETDTKLPRRNVRLYCEETHHHKEGLIWHVQVEQGGRGAQIERGGKMLDIPKHPHSMHIHHGDIVHQRKRSGGKATYPCYLETDFKGTEIEVYDEDEDEDEDTQSEEEVNDGPSTPPAYGLSLSPIADPSDEMMRSEVNAKPYGRPREGVEVVVGRGKGCIPVDDVYLPRQHVRLFCETESGEPEDQQWACSTLGKRSAMVTRGDEQLSVPAAPDKLPLLDGDVLHLRNVKKGFSLLKERGWALSAAMSGKGSKHMDGVVHIASAKGNPYKGNDYPMLVSLAPASTRLAVSFAGWTAQQPGMLDYYKTGNKEPEPEPEPEYEEEVSYFQAEMIDYYGRKGQGGGESLAELAGLDGLDQGAGPRRPSEVEVLVNEAL